MAPRLSRLFGVVVFPLLRLFGFLLVDGLFLPFGAFPIGWWLVLFDHLRLTISASGSRYGRGLMQRPNSAALQKSVKSARRLLHQPGDGAAEGSEVQLRDSARRHREVQARRAPDSLRGRAEKGAGDAHVVVVGRADVHHQVGGRAQPVPAAEGVASPRRQRVGAHDVPGEGAQGHGVALQLEASHREAGRGHGALAVGAHQEIS